MVSDKDMSLSQYIVPRCSIVLTVTFFIVLLALLWLGFWQLARAEEKQQLLNRAKITATARVENITHYSASRLSKLAQGTPILLQGRYDDEKTFLLDNQINKGKFGYLVITPFIAEYSGQLFLVVRGWVAGSLDRRILPDISTPEHKLTLRAKVLAKQEKPFQLAQIPAAASWPKVVQSKAIESLSAYLSTPVYDRLLWQMKPEAGLQMIAPVVVNMSPQKHQAYAMQWFSMSVLLAIIYLLNTTNLKLLFPRKKTNTIEGDDYAG
ncbi:cytochrome oxidase assembly protein ShyY1 [Sinobacterium caligoides]|uniref:SURF1-like protein n=1 Tax=Sinobacterium caligoides TaxID=933926 RepID=A0A3N2DGP4_9GAMM|nr:SURF1 family protein [Sinobacterium caligoides]ROR98976.1 cytochrome oxidase assembly protein ShyY1 [Sinobacterium caligoides]